MLEVGITGRQSEKVTETNTAAAVGSGLLPVYATPAMILLIEKTAAMSIMSELPDGAGTVGTRLDISHSSPSIVGSTVHCKTVLSEMDGRRLVFKAEVFDDKGKIGSGTHERFIIDNERFMQKANSK